MAGKQIKIREYPPKEINENVSFFKRGEYSKITIPLNVIKNALGPENFQKIKNEVYRKEYYGRPEIKEKQRKYAKEYYSKPKNKKRLKEYQEEYYGRPEVKEKMKEYSNLPEVKEKNNERAKIAYQKKMA